MPKLKKLTTIEKDLEFLKEIKQRLETGIEKRDPEQLKYALKMVDDWIDEIETS